MTGYGRGQASTSAAVVTVEVASVNRRSLDTTFSLGKEYSSLEPRLAEQIRKRFHRGKVHTTMSVEAADATGLTWNDEAAAATLARLKSFARAQGVTVEMDAQALLELVLQHRGSDQTGADDELIETVLEALGQALDELAEMRAREGKALQDDMEARGDALKAALAIIREHAPTAPARYREILLARLQQASLDLDLDDERVLKEVALFADRVDVTEEITRLDSHLEQFAVMIAEDGAIGRKLDFLLQEINREFNTVGSKANDIRLTRAVLDAKNEIDRLREQLANVE